MKDRFVDGGPLADDEELRDSQGRLVDDAYVTAAVAEAVAVARSKGRPSLSVSGTSPTLRVRVSRELDEAVRRAAERAGTSRAEWVRHVLDEAVHRAG